MKKLLFIAISFAGMMFASCGNCCKSDAVVSDSDSVVLDSVDTVLVDSVVADSVCVD